MYMHIESRHWCNKMSECRDSCGRTTDTHGHIEIKITLVCKHIDRKKLSSNIIQFVHGKESIIQSLALL